MHSTNHSSQIISNLADIETEKPSKRKEQAIRRKKQILDEAVKLFVQNGYDGTSTKEIADAAEISEGLVFHYFPTKSDLLAAILHTQHGFLQDLKELLISKNEISAKEMLNNLAQLWFEKLRQEKAITLIILGTAQTNPLVADALKNIIQTGVTLLADYLKLCVQRDELRSDLPTETSAQMFFSAMIVFFIRHRDLPSDQWNIDVDLFIIEMLDVWFHGAR